MTTYYVRTDPRTVLGPYAPDQIRAWIEEGRLTPETECSPDGRAWGPVTAMGEEASAAPPAPRPAPVAQGGFPEPSLLIRQGANVQGPYLMSRIRGYVAQRRIQPYMLFSHDGIFWVGPEHVPGLLPANYVPLPPPTGPTAVPDAAPPVARAAPTPGGVLTMPRGSAPPRPGDDIGSSTLVGFRLEEADLEPGGPPPPPPVSRAAALPETPLVSPVQPVTYHVRLGGHDVYGPCEPDTLAAWIADGRVDASSELSTDGRTWFPATHVPGLFGATAPRRVPGSVGGVAPEATDDAPALARRRRTRRR